MCDLPRVYSDSTPKARKEHRCCECRGTISVGEVYHIFSGYWDSWSTFKTCDDCQELRKDIANNLDNEEWPIFGQLNDDIFEGRDNGEITRFMDIRRKRGAPLSPRLWMENR